MDRGVAGDVIPPKRQKCGHRGKNVGVCYSAPRILSNSSSSALISIPEGGSSKGSAVLVSHFQASLWLWTVTPSGTEGWGVPGSLPVAGGSRGKGRRGAVGRRGGAGW